MLRFHYFSSCKTLQELKTRYRELVFQFHPDRAGKETEEIMKAINAEYELAFDFILKNPANEQEKKSNFYANVNDGFREQIYKVIFIPGIYIEICGSWIWITGNTKPVKDILKQAGFFYAPQKQAWYWRPAEYRSHRHKTWDLSRIREVYGSQAVETQEREKLAYAT